MIQKKTKIFLLIFVVSLLLNLSGCLTVEQKRELADFAATATEYYKDKYGQDPHIENCGYYIDAGGLFPRRTKHMFARCSNREFIFYDADKDLIVDNRQSREISAAIEAELKRQMEVVTDTISGSELVIHDYCSTAYAGAYEGNFYHAFYDGDIATFLKAEDVQLTANLYLLCDKDAPWQEAQKKCETIIRSNFRTDNQVSLIVLTKECFEKTQSEYGAQADLDDLGCYAKYIMTGETTDAYIQRYIKIADGIYVTCAEKNFVFEEGDVIAVEALTEGELNAKIFARWDKLPAVSPENEGISYMTPDKAHETYSVVKAASPIYQLVFSERVKKAFPNGEITSYLLLVSQEAGCEADVRLLQYQDKDNSYRCSVISPVNGGDAGWNDLNENDYYFIGNISVATAKDKD